MYTHARQFPHFAGMGDDQIRAVAKRAVAKHPRYLTLRQIQKVVTAIVVVATLVSAVLAGAGVGLGLMCAGALGTLAIVIWNAIWVNTALYRITHDEMQQNVAPRFGGR